MDPNAAWTEIASLLNMNADLSEDDKDRLSELAEALVQWITRDGFLPHAASASGLGRHGLVRVLDGLLAAYVA